MPNIMIRSFAVLLVGVVLSAIVAAQTLSLVNATVETPPTGQINVIVKAAGLTPKAIQDGSISKSKLTVSDVTNNNRAIFTQLAGSEYLGGGGQTAYWHTTWQIAGLRSGASETRLLKLQLDNVIEIAQLIIHGSPDSQVSLSGPGFPLRLNHSKCAPILISTSGRLTRSQAHSVDSRRRQNRTKHPSKCLRTPHIDSAGNSSRVW